QRHPAVRAGAGQPGLARGAEPGQGARARAQHVRRPRDVRPGGRGARAGVGEAGGGPVLKVSRAAAAYLDHLTVERALAGNTLASYRRDLARYVEALGDPEIATVTTVRVAGYLAGLREGDAGHPPLAPASAARAVSAVRGLHRFAVREGLADDDPAKEVVPPTPPRRLPKALSVPEIEALLGAVPG